MIGIAGSVHWNKNVYFHCLFDDDDGDDEDDDDDEISGKHNHKINIKVNRISMFIWKVKNVKKICLSEI